jgi:hypothetical protein
MMSTERLQSTIPVELNNIINYNRNQVPKKVVLSDNDHSMRQNVTDRPKNDSKLSTNLEFVDSLSSRAQLHQFN